MDVPKIAQSSAVQSVTLEEVDKQHIIEALKTTGWRAIGKGGALKFYASIQRRLNRGCKNQASKGAKTISDISGVS